MTDNLNFSDTALKVLHDRYLWRDSDGKVTETPRAMLERVARVVSKGDKCKERIYYDIMANLDFLPNSPTLMNAGREGVHGQLSACYVLDVPDSMAGISEVVGWPQKSVDALADRIVFDGFVGVGDDGRDPLGLDSILSDNDFDVELPQAIRSALTHSCSFLNVRSAEPEDGLRSKVSVSFRSALYETGLWDYARRGLSAALSITDIDRSQYAQANTIVPSELMLYMPGYTIRIRRTQSGRYHADAPRNTYMDHVPVYLIPYHQDLNRPFGRSRISREVMSITDTAVRTMLRMEVSAEFYSSPQRYLIGADEPPEDKNGRKLTGWEATIS